MRDELSMKRGLALTGRPLPRGQASWRFVGGRTDELAEADFPWTGLDSRG